MQTTPLIAGLAVGAAAYSARLAMNVFQSFKAAGPRMRQFYKGGFLPEMTRREAALILGIRESSPEERIKEAHRRIMIANHPDAGGSSFIAAKVNEAKDLLLGKKKGSGSVFWYRAGTLFSLLWNPKAVSIVDKQKKKERGGERESAACVLYNLACYRVCCMEIESAR